MNDRNVKLYISVPCISVRKPFIVFLVHFINLKENISDLFIKHRHKSHSCFYNNKKYFDLTVASLHAPHLLQKSINAMKCISHRKSIVN